MFYKKIFVQVTQTHVVVAGGENTGSPFFPRQSTLQRFENKTAEHWQREEGVEELERSWFGSAEVPLNWVEDLCVKVGSLIQHYTLGEEVHLETKNILTV